ncbi:MAG TPA: polysaccharide deacetylase family protein [Salinimicrobium sp.]|nr:polysaccharide deacetylase family protein [Salinimicrobium sp.]
MFEKVPGPVIKLFPERVWKIPTQKRAIYLTFDDGPIPELTPWVLEQLKKYNAKATFFCIGENIEKHPEIFRKIIFDGHSLGNHTQNHLNGWKTSSEEYVRNVLKAEVVIESNFPEKEEEYHPKTKLFRPPFGRITGKQVKLLREKNYKIIMWSVLSMDYSKNISVEKCYNNVVKNGISGNIFVFHDSLKAEKNLRSVLPRVLEHFQKEGFSFEKLEV